MLVLIPHQNQIAEMVKVQKDFIRKFNKANSTKKPRMIFFQHTPMWIFLPDFDSHFSFDDEKNIKNQLKKAAEKIIEVEVAGPSLYFSKDLQKQVLGCQTTIKTEFGNCKSELTVCASTASRSGLNEAVLEAGTFSLKLKVFRLAWAEKIQDSAWAVTESVWKKTK